MPKTRLLVIGERMISMQNVARFAIPLAVVAGLGFSCGPTAADIIDILSPSPALAATATQYADGEYFAEGKGIGGKVPVTVTIDGGAIVGVEVGDNSETQGIGSKAIEQLPSAIVAANGTEGVDAVSGATVTSKAILTAVDDCLEQASHTDKSGEPKSETTSSSKDVYYNNGEYFAEGKGIGGKVPVTVTIDGGAIVSVEVGKNSETQGIGSKAIEQLPGAIIKANGTDGVDATSGATVTSKAIFTAVDDCLEQAGTTNVKPTTELPTQEKSVSMETDAREHLGTLHFGNLSVTIPDGYECHAYKEELGDDSNLTRGLYGSSDSLSVLYVAYIEMDDLRSLSSTQSKSKETILGLAELTLGGKVTDYQPLDGYELTALEDFYFGVYHATLQTDKSEVIVLVGGAFDEDGHLLLVQGIPLSEDSLAELIESIYSISGGYLPSSGSNSTTKPNQTSSRSSYTPTRGEQNALSTAHDYLDTMAFSRSGLIDQLKYEGYTSSEAEYAVDNCGADWDYQAVLMAEEYLDAMPFSRSGLIEQLEYEGFSYSQASAAATAAGL